MKSFIKSILSVLMSVIALHWHNINIMCGLFYHLVVIGVFVGSVIPNILGRSFASCPSRSFAGRLNAIS